MVDKGCNVPLCGSLSQIFPKLGLGASRGKGKGTGTGYLQQPLRKPASENPPAGPLVLRIRYSVLQQFPAPPPTIVTPLDAERAIGISSSLGAHQLPGHLVALQGPHQEFLEFTNTEHSGWLIAIAHDLFDPSLERGRLLRGPLLSPNPSDAEIQQPSDFNWGIVSPNEPIYGAIYEYAVPSGVIVLPTKRSRYRNHSRTDTSNGNAQTMRNQVIIRDRSACSVFRVHQPPRCLTNSHLIPKRMGDEMTRMIVAQFSNGHPDDYIRVFSPAVGLAIANNFDPYVDTYQMGFRYFEHTDQMEVHMFESDTRELTIAAFRDPNHTYPLAHQHQVPRNPATAIGPPNTPTIIPAVAPAALRWHYLQCVITHFGTNAYKTIPNIAYYDDDDWDDAHSPLRMGVYCLQLIETCVESI